MQVAVWDGVPSLRLAGTSADVARWAESGSRSIIVEVQRNGTATPPGAVFVTGACAALLALDARSAFACEYVGRVATAKSYGEFPMYLLRRAAAGRTTTS